MAVPVWTWFGLICLLSFLAAIVVLVALILVRRSERRGSHHAFVAADPSREFGGVSLSPAPPMPPVALGGAQPAKIQPGTIQRMPARDAQFIYTTGDRPLDGYTIKRGIGSGGFGEVYYAVSDGGKEVAIKLVQRHLDVELRGVGQCLNLKHPNLVTLFDVKQAANGDYWVVMEYLSGASLSDVLAANPNGLPHDQVNAWLRGIADGVGYLHEHGIVHRDLKPGNIFVDQSIVKIGDYGLAKFISASRRSGQTESVGTVHYMAPEISHGRYGKEIDLYALGVILYELLTGRVPFDGQSPGEIMMKHLTAQPDTSVLPEPYRSVVARLLAKSPEDRHQSVAAMLDELTGKTPASVAPANGGAAPIRLKQTVSWHSSERPSSVVGDSSGAGNPVRWLGALVLTVLAVMALIYAWGFWTVVSRGFQPGGIEFAGAVLLNGGAVLLPILAFLAWRWKGSAREAHAVAIVAAVGLSVVTVAAAISFVSILWYHGDKGLPISEPAAQLIFGCAGCAVVGLCALTCYSWFWAAGGSHSNRALSRAAARGDSARVQDLLDRGANVNGIARGQTALIAAASRGHVTTVRVLLERGADVNARTRGGETALSLATVAGHTAVVEVLLAAGADVNSRASDGDTPLIEAAYAGHVAILRAMLAHGPDLTARSGGDGSTPLIWAAYGGHTACVEALLEHGANVNEKDTGDGSTPLIWAAYGNHPNVVRVLLDHGADPNETNSSGETALDHAESDTIRQMLAAAIAQR